MIEVQWMLVVVRERVWLSMIVLSLLVVVLGSSVRKEWPHCVVRFDERIAEVCGLCGREHAVEGVGVVEFVGSC
jgi:hypothetical protein